MMRINELIITKSNMHLLFSNIPLMLYSTLLISVGHAAYEINVSGGGSDVGSWDNSFHNFEDVSFIQLFCSSYESNLLVYLPCVGLLW
ncbi:hypothetical protein HanPSC8_Chr11g0463991 [Helianthus annuus]|nr:hypothetical protein HanPSC8_Chr11g0463991 [Helianthus annuus]